MGNPKVVLGGVAGFASAALAPSVVKAALALLLFFAHYLISKEAESHVETRLGVFAGFLAFLAATPIAERFLSKSQWVVDYFYLFLATCLGVLLVRAFVARSETDDCSSNDYTD